MAYYPTMFESRWPTVILTGIGVANFIITVSDTAGLHAKQKVTLSAVGQEPEAFTIWRVLSDTQLEVIPWTGESTGAGTDKSLQNPTEFNGGVLTMSEERRNNMGFDIILRAVYDNEPSTALRNVLVNKYGAYYDDTNPLPVAFDGTVEIGDVSIVEGGNTMTVNSDGSINVNVIETPISGITVLSLYNAVASVASNATQTLVSYTVPVGYTAVLQRADVAGDTYGQFTVLLNGQPFDSKYTYYGASFNETFDYTTGTSNGFVLNPGDVVLIQVFNFRPAAGNYNARLQVQQIA